MSEHDETIWRTSSGRVGKMMAILGGTVIVGAIMKTFCVRLSLTSHKSILSLGFVVRLSAKG